MPRRQREELVEDEAPSTTPTRSILELAAEDIEERSSFAHVSEGEYALQIQKITARFTKAGNPALNCAFSIEGSWVNGVSEPLDIEDGVQLGNVFNFHNLPYKDAKPTAARFFRDELASLRLSFGISKEDLADTINEAFSTLSETGAGELEITTFNNLVGPAYLIVETDDSDREQNVIKRYIER